MRAARGAVAVAAAISICVLTSFSAKIAAQPAGSPAKGPPRYRACGSVVVAGAHAPTYAHNVSCRTALAVAKDCISHNCFGSFPLPYNGVGEPALPDGPAFRPLGFQCYQADPPYTAGVPTPRVKTRRDERPFLCWRQANRPGPDVVIYQQLVAYWL